MTEAAEQRVPTLEEVQMAWVFSRWTTGNKLPAEGSKAEFDRFVEEWEARTRKGIARQIKSNCTPSGEAYKAGGDALIAAVADWVADPPGWVPSLSVILADVPWVETSETEKELRETVFAQKKRIEELKERVEFLEQQEAALRHDVGLLDLISGIINSTDPAKAVRIQEILEEKP